MTIRNLITKAMRIFVIVYYENRATYERSKLGLLWIPLSTIIFVTALSLVFKTTESSEKLNFLLYVFVGYSLWLFILESISQSTTIIQTQIDFANHNNMSLIELFINNLFSRLFRHLLNITALFVLVAFLSFDTVLYSFFAYIPFLLIVMLTSLGLSYLINYTTLIFPDTGKAILIVARFLFFMSPIFWIADPNETGFRSILVTYNPVSYFLSVSRQIFFIEPFNLNTCLIAICISILTCVASYVCYQLTNNNVRNIS